MFYGIYERRYGYFGGGGGGVERAETVMMVDHCGQMGSMDTRLMV